MQIRRATIDDAPAIARVHVDSWRTTYKGIIADEFLAVLSYERREVSWRNTLSLLDHHTFVLVAETADFQIVGFASGGPEREGDPIYQGEIYALYLLQAYQKQGIGRLLVKTAVQELLQHGITSMLIWVLANNPSRRFYEAIGGEYVREKHIQIGDRQVPEVAYGWKTLDGVVNTDY